MIDTDNTHPDLQIDVAQNLQHVRGAMAKASVLGGRAADAVQLIAVSKSQPLERIEAALAAGQRVFGENYVQESAGRWPALRERFSDVAVHMIGPLQTNKARQAVELFDCIQSVDRFKLAAAIKKEFDRQERKIQLFAQINTGEEPQKAGILPAETDEFIHRCRVELGLEFAGLMAIPPAGEELALHAMLLEKYAKKHGIAAISIGMSNDFETACEFGATHVRVGSAIFGERAKK